MKKIITLVISILFLMQTVSFSADVTIYSEEDTKQLVEKLNSLGVFDKFDDESFFGENTPVKRHEVASAVSDLLNLKELTSENSSEVLFYDVPQYCEYIGSVNFVASLGIMTGFDNGLFMPENEMTITHVLKTMVAALGYQWKANNNGGYPAGYIKIATELNLMQGVKKGLDETATRLDFLKIVDNSLEAPVCVASSVGIKEMNFETDENKTLLSEYHDIYLEKGIVESDKLISITPGYEPNDERVKIGDFDLLVNGVNNVYSYLGHNVEFYYKKGRTDDENALISVTSTNKNTITRILKRDFNSFSDGKISYQSKNGSAGKITVDKSVTVICNGETVKSNVNECITNYKGTLTAIDNNKDSSADVIIINNYIYDKAERVDTNSGKIYAKNIVLMLDDYDKVSITMAESGEAVTADSLTEGDVFGYIETNNGENLIIRVIRGSKGVTVENTSFEEDEFGADDDAEYGIGLLNDEQRLKIKPGNKITIYTDDGYNAVWVESAEETVSIGYLINVYEDTKLGKEQFTGIKLVDDKGEVVKIKASDTQYIVFNGKKIKATTLRERLNNVKVNYNLGGDSDVSQVVAYKTDTEGKITEIDTITEDDDSKLYYEYGYKNYGAAKIRDDGYNSARYSVDRKTGVNYCFAIMNTHPIFEVPETNQVSVPDNYYKKKTYTKSEYKNGSWQIDSYVKGKDDVVPKAMVIFKKEVSTDVNFAADGEMFFVEKMLYTRDDDGYSRATLQGVYKSEKKSFYLDNEAEQIVEGLMANDDNPDEKCGLTPGDATNVILNNADEISAIQKVYDYETNTIKKAYEDATLDSDFAVRVLSVYNLTDDRAMLEAFAQSLESGIPGDEDKILINLYLRTRQKDANIFFDEKTKTCNVGTLDDVIDYKRDSTNYTRIVISYWDNYIGGMMYYNK